MRALTGFVFLLIAALPYLAMLAGGRREAGSPDEPAGGPAELLSVISPHRREVRLEYSRGFREWMAARHGRRVDIRWIDVGGASKVMKDLESRYARSPDRPGVDVLFGGGVTPYYTAIRNGWLAEVDLPPEVLAAIPAECAAMPVYDPGRRWFGVALSGFGILYNGPLAQRLGLPAPALWEDLARPEYRTWVGSGDPRSSGSVHMCYEIILQAYGLEKGWALIARLCANVRSFGEGGGTVPREVASGDIVAGMVIDQYAKTVIDAVGDGLLVFVLPEQMTMVGPDAIGVLKGGNAELSTRFVEYVLSADGQRLLFQPPGVNGQQFGLYRLPVRADLYAEPDAPRANPYRYRGGFSYDEELGNRRWDLVNDLVGVCLIDAHQELVAAWEAVIRAGRPPELEARLTELPVPAAEAEALAADLRDSRRRLDLTGRWANEAQERYRAVRRAADGMAGRL